MKYLLDTNICIFMIKNQIPRLNERLRKLSAGDLAISTITLAGLRPGL